MIRATLYMYIEKYMCIIIYDIPEMWTPLLKRLLCKSSGKFYHKKSKKKQHILLVRKAPSTT